MASTIIQRLIGGNADNAIQLDNSQFGRLVSLPVGWATIRVGVRLHMTDSGVNLGTTPRLAIGLGSGTTNMVEDASCDNFIGLVNNNATWTRAASNYQSEQWCPAKKVGAALTLGTTTVVAAAYIMNQAAAAAADRSVRFVDITKGAPNYTVQGFYRNSSGAGDVSQATFLTQMIIGVPVVTNHTQGTARTIAFDEIAGTLNAVQVWWDRSDALMEINDLAVAVLA